MKKSIVYISAIALVFVFGGCSSKEVYKPQNVKGSKSIDGKISGVISDVVGNVALLDNGVVISKDAKELMAISKDDRLINSSGHLVIVQNSKKELKFISTNSQTQSVVFPLNKDVAGATLSGDILAVLFTNNEIALFSFKDKKLLFKEESDRAVAVDNRIVNPLFLNELVLFATLDGKIVIVNSQTKQPLRSIIVSSEDYFNNITYLNTIKDTLVASTPYGILSLGQKESRQKYDIRNIVFSDETIYIATKQGDVIALNENLEQKAKQKFPFANFRAISASKDSVYLLEANGYMIVLPKDLSKYDVYDVSFNKKDRVLTGDKAFYFDDKYILTP